MNPKHGRDIALMMVLDVVALVASLGLSALLFNNPFDFAKSWPVWVIVWGLAGLGQVALVFNMRKK